jgi:hypothetical protein
MSKMLKEALGKRPDLTQYRAAAAQYHKVMLTEFPKVITLRIYDHALLVHVPDLLSQGTLLDGRSWFLEAFNRVWENQLQFHSNKGGGRKTKEQEENAELAKNSEGREICKAWKANKMDRQAMGTLWLTTLPRFRGPSTTGRNSGVHHVLQ